MSAGQAAMAITRRVRSRAQRGVASVSCGRSAPGVGGVVPPRRGWGGWYAGLAGTVTLGLARSSEAAIAAVAVATCRAGRDEHSIAKQVAAALTPERSSRTRSQPC